MFVSMIWSNCNLSHKNVWICEPKRHADYSKEHLKYPLAMQTVLNSLIKKVLEEFIHFLHMSLGIGQPFTSEKTPQTDEKAAEVSKKGFPTQSHSLLNTCWHYSAQQQQSQSSWWSGWQQRERQKNNLCVTVHQPELHTGEVWWRM